MDITTYTQDAIKTEARIETLQVNITQLRAVLSILIAAGNVLDVIKKDTFYGLPTDPVKAAARQDRLQEHTSAIGGLLSDHGYYKDQQLSTISNVDSRVFHAIVGVATEAVEMLEALDVALGQNKPLDGVNLLEEAADVCWYLAILHDATNSSWGDNLQRNIDKLRARYPGKFDKQATENRDLVLERQILESGVIDQPSETSNGEDFTTKS